VLSRKAGVVLPSTREEVGKDLKVLKPSGVLTDTFSIMVGSFICIVGSTYIAGAAVAKDGFPAAKAIGRTTVANALPTILLSIVGALDP